MSDQVENIFAGGAAECANQNEVDPKLLAAEIEPLAAELKELKADKTEIQICEKKLNEKIEAAEEKIRSIWAPHVRGSSKASLNLSSGMVVEIAEELSIGRLKPLGDDDGLHEDEYGYMLCILFDKEPSSEAKDAIAKEVTGGVIPKFLAEEAATKVLHVEVDNRSEWLLKNGFENSMNWDIHHKRFESIAKNLFKENSFEIPGTKYTHWQKIKVK